jgi:hypothetical protein
MPCKFKIKDGTCPWGHECIYGHSDELINAAKAACARESARPKAKAKAKPGVPATLQYTDGTSEALPDEWAAYDEDYEVENWE